MEPFGNTARAMAPRKSHRITTVTRSEIVFVSDTLHSRPYEAFELTRNVDDLKPIQTADLPLKWGFNYALYFHPIARVFGRLHLLPTVARLAPWFDLAAKIVQDVITFVGAHHEHRVMADPRRVRRRDQKRR